MLAAPRICLVYRLYGLSATPYSAKLRALLRFRRIPHLRVPAMPALSGPTLEALSPTLRDRVWQRTSDVSSSLSVLEDPSGLEVDRLEWSSDATGRALEPLIEALWRHYVPYMRANAPAAREDAGVRATTSDRHPHRAPSNRYAARCWSGWRAKALALAQRGESAAAGQLCKALGLGRADTARARA